MKRFMTPLVSAALLAGCTTTTGNAGTYNLKGECLELETRSTFSNGQDLDIAVHDLSIKSGGVIVDAVRISNEDGSAVIELDEQTRVERDGVSVGGESGDTTITLEPTEEDQDFSMHEQGDRVDASVHFQDSDSSFVLTLVSRCTD